MILSTIDDNNYILKIYSKYEINKKKFIKIQ